MIALFSYFSKINFKVGGSARFLGGTGGKIGLNVIFPELKQGLFQFVPGTSEHSILHILSPNSPSSNPKKHQEKLIKLYFLDKFQTVPSFFTLSLFWGSVSNFITPPPPPPIWLLSKLH